MFNVNACFLKNKLSLSLSLAPRPGAVLAVGAQVQPQLLVHPHDVLFDAPASSRSETPLH